MPHCIIEHSNTIDSELIFPLVFSGTLNSKLFEPDGSDIKVRSKAYDSYSIGQQKTNFIHVVLKILSGRSNKEKHVLSNSVLKRLETLNLKKCSITIEVVDIDTASYVKMVT